ncbi:MAG: hypothetical protein K6F68_03045 [Clostridiales bacterium]|nr:hypothetical protein [Clostridiales bacterium]
MDTLKKTFEFESIPGSLEEMMKLEGAGLNDPYAVTALCVLAFNEFPKNREACFEMLNYLKGPRPLTNFDISFIKDRFMDGNDYVPRSYFAGTSPDNNYTPSMPCSITVFEGAHSRDQFNEGYLKIFLRSSGADSDRYIVLRHKPSTDQWFVWQFEGLLVGIRQPKSSDPWA